MHNFYEALKFINKTIYKPNHLFLSSIVEEKQNSEYAAGRFIMFSHKKANDIRFRVAKVTPKKVGQFVTFWQKDNNDINQPFQYDESPSLLVVTTFDESHQFGQFVFPKDILVKKGIIKSAVSKGKMGIRVYPSWDTATSKTAIDTQKWQLEYFFVVNQLNSLPVEKILLLYNQS